MKSEPGTYALILECDSNARVQIGRWLEFSLEPGNYIYIGSAFGPGGVRARVSRHFREGKVKHWHVDYLREHVNPLAAWISYEPKRLEHRWAQVLCSLERMSLIQGFGCSDCQCSSHLFYTSHEPNLALFARQTGSKIEVWSP